MTCSLSPVVVALTVVDNVSDCYVMADHLMGILCPSVLLISVVSTMVVPVTVVTMTVPLLTVFLMTDGEFSPAGGLFTGFLLSR